MAEHSVAQSIQRSRDRKHESVGINVVEPFRENADLGTPDVFPIGLLGSEVGLRNGVMVYQDMLADSRSHHFLDESGCSTRSDIDHPASLETIQVVGVLYAPKHSVHLRFCLGRSLIGDDRHRSRCLRRIGLFVLCLGLRVMHKFEVEAYHADILAVANDAIGQNLEFAIVRLGHDDGQIEAFDSRVALQDGASVGQIALRKVTATGRMGMDEPHQVNPGRIPILREKLIE